MKDYDYQTLLDDALSRVPDGYDKREGSVIYTTLAPVCFELTRSYWLLTWLMNLFLPDTAIEDWLDRCVGQFGVERKQAVKARRVIRTYDNIGSPLEIPISSRFRINDLTLAVTDKVNTGVYQAEAEIAGILGNQYQGDLLPIQNINNLGRAELGEVLLEGADAETDEALRDRYYDHVRRSPFGGNVADYEEKTLAIEGIGSVKVFPIWNGPGTVLLMIGNADGRTASAELIKKVQDLFQPADDPTGGLAPIGHVVTVSTSKDKMIDITASLRIKPGESFELLKQKAIAEIKAYIESIPFDESTIFQSRVTVAILNVSGILDAVNVQINGAAANLVLDKTAQSYEVPVIGTITLQEAS
ncbi:baseplate J/gp47 family protein [Holdemania massiliensis]|uniref:baseplate J/gp47 family protein n=1 Tax=Holdemania massiliensis TaxID=1468449 RepID=UPI003522BEF8